MKVVYPIRSIPDPLDRRLRILAGSRGREYVHDATASMLAIASGLVQADAVSSSRVALRWQRLAGQGAMRGVVGLEARSRSKPQSKQRTNTSELMAELAGLKDVSSTFAHGADNGSDACPDSIPLSEHAAAVAIVRNARQFPLEHIVDSGQSALHWLSHPTVPIECAGIDSPWEEIDTVYLNTRDDSWIADIVVRPLPKDSQFVARYLAFPNRILHDIAATRQERSGHASEGHFPGASDDTLSDCRRAIEEFLESYHEEPQFEFAIRVAAEDERIAAAIGARLGFNMFGSGGFQIVRVPKRCLAAGWCDSMFNLVADAAVADSGQDEAWRRLIAASPNDVRPADVERDSDTLRWSRSLMLRTIGLEEVEKWFAIPVAQDRHLRAIPASTDPHVSETRSVIRARDLDRDKDVIIAPKTLTRHMFITGMTGSGKTKSLHNILATLWGDGKSDDRTPFLVIEPAKVEHRELRKVSEALKRDLVVLTPTRDHVWPFRINPLEPIDTPYGPDDQAQPARIHIEMLEAVIRAAVPMPNPLPFLIPSAIDSVYRRMGWRLTGKNRADHIRVPRFADLMEEIRTVIASTAYDSEVKGSIASVAESRFGYLNRGTVGQVLGMPYGIPSIQSLLNRPVVLELDGLNQDAANLVTLFLLRVIREVRRVEGTSEDGLLRHVVVLEEAHNLVEADASGGDEELSFDPRAEASKAIEQMLAEVRSLGQGFIVADQSPAAMPAGILRNTRTKLLHQVVDARDRLAMVETLGLSEEQAEDVTRLEQGEAMMVTDLYARPTRVKLELLKPIELEGEDNSVPTSDAVLASWYRSTNGDAATFFAASMNRLADVTVEHSNQLYDEYVTQLCRILRSCGFHRDMYTQSFASSNPNITHGVYECIDAILQRSEVQAELREFLHQKRPILVQEMVDRICDPFRFAIDSNSDNDNRCAELCERISKQWSAWFVACARFKTILEKVQGTVSADSGDGSTKGKHDGEATRPAVSAQGAAVSPPDTSRLESVTTPQPEATDTNDNSRPQQPKPSSAKKRQSKK